jgi:hypothetical protein
MLTNAQLLSLKADMTADAVLGAIPHNSSDDAQRIADAYNLLAAPDWYVWRTTVSEAEYVSSPGVDVAAGSAATTWSWTAYIARSQGERDAWARLFASSGGFCNPSLANVRQGVNDIFSGTSNSAPAQRNHLLVLSKRKATRAEKLFASGAGSFAAPALLSFEGSLAWSDVANAWAAV